MLQSSLPLPGGCRGGCPGFCGRLPVRCGRSRVAAMGGAYGFCERFPVRCGRGLWLLWEGLTAAAGGFPGPSWCLWPPWCPWPLWQVLRSSAPVLPEYGDLGVMCQFLKTCFCSLLRQVLSFPWLFLVTHEVMGGLGSLQGPPQARVLRADLAALGHQGIGEGLGGPWTSGSCPAVSRKLVIHSEPQFFVYKMRQ